MRPQVVIPAGVAALLVLGGAWFLASYDRVPAKEWVGPSGEARLRDFLAAERFAERMGWKASELRSLLELNALPAGGVLLLPNRRQALNAGRMAEILQWVERGGHLIVEAEFLGVADPLFDLLGVARVPADPARKPVAFELPHTGRRLSAVMDGPMRLETAEEDIRLRVGAAGNVKLVSFARGQGIVTSAVSLRFARNRLIGGGDHAELLWHLLALTPGRELQVYFRPEQLSLWDFLTEHAAPALASSALLLALWLWRIAPRFGPVAPDAPPGRRRLLDHLRASGRYYWAKGLRARLVSAARDAALRRIGRVQPDFAVAPAAERARRLAALAAIPQEEAERFLAAGGALRGAAFIQIAQTAQRVHSALERGKR